MLTLGMKGIVRRNFIFGIAVALAGAAGLASARADVLANYAFTSSSLASTDADPASVASAITLGSGLTDATRFTTAGNPGNALRVNGDETDGTTFAAAISSNDFFGFMLSPSSGDRFNFTTATVDLVASSAALSTNVRLQASINGAAFINVDTVSAFSTTTYTTETFDLSAGNNNAALASGASVLLRVLVFDNSNSATVYTGFDNLIVNGTITAAAPEPGSVASMLGLGSLAAGGLVLRRRKV